MSSFDIDVTRDGGCWMVHIREVNGPAQGRTISEAEWTARQMLLWPPGCPSTTSPCGPPASQRPKRHSGQVGEQLVDPALLQRQRDRLA